VAAAGPAPGQGVFDQASRRRYQRTDDPLMTGRPWGRPSMHRPACIDPVA